MRQLTGIDASFLYMETPSTFGHVSSLILFDPKDTPGAGYESTRAIFEHRLHLLDPMRRRLVQVPFNLDHAYWIDRLAEMYGNREAAEKILHLQRRRRELRAQLEAAES